MKKQGSLIAFLGAAAAAAGLAYFFHQADMREEISALESSEKAAMSLAAGIISEDLSHAVSDLEILSSSRLFDRYSLASRKEILPELERKFISFSLNRAAYESFRFIDPSGMEMARVDFNNGDPIAASEIHLVSLAGSSYFSEAVKMARGWIFVVLAEGSDPDRKGRKRILFLAPVFNGAGEKVGLIQLDFHIPHLEQRLKQILAIRLGEAVLADGQGNLLAASAHAGEEKRAQARGMNVKYPLAWREISQMTAGQFLNEEGLFTFAEAAPLAFPAFGYESHAAIRQSSPIKIISLIPAEALYSQTRKIQSRLALLYALFASLLALAGMIAQRFSLREGSLPFKTRSPAVLLAMVIIIIYASEFMVMLALFALPQMGNLSGAALDATLLTALILPMIYFLLFRPLMEHIRSQELTEESLKKSEENVKAIIRSAGEGIVVVDDNFRISMVNGELLNIFGYREEELIGQKISILSSPSTGSGADAGDLLGDTGFFRDIFRSTGRRLKTMGRKKSGAVFPFEARIEKTSGAPNQSVYVGSIRDITERESAQQALLESEEKFRSSFDNAAIGMVLTDLEGKFLRVNSAFCSMIGYGREELLNKSFVEITHPDDVKEDVSNVQRALLGQIDSFQMEKRYFHKRGGEIWVLLNVAIVRSADKNPLFFIGHIQDITERKKTETELIRAKEDAVESNLLKDKFVSLVAHDLRSPFVSITGMIRLLLSGKDDARLSERQAMMLKSALSAGEQSVELIDELLNISRLKTGVIKPRRKFLDARNAGLSAIAAQSHLASRKNVSLINRVPEGIRIFADPRLFAEVISNLVNNAVKFSNPGGQVEIIAPDGGKAGLGVKDGGVGVRKEYLGKLFRYDERTHTRGTLGEPGTGLGLPLSYDIMLAHGGSLDCSSVEGEGTVFYALLPKMAPRILVVEKDKSLLKIIESGFAGEGVELEEALDYHAGRKALGNSDIHLVIADMENQMEEGIEFLKYVSRIRLDHDVPLIAIIAAHQEGQADMVLSSGAADFATKPLDVEAMIARVRRFIQ